MMDYNAMLRAVTNPQDHPAITAALDAGAFGGDAARGDAARDGEARDGEAGGVDEAALGLTILLDGVEAVLGRAAQGG
jgi:hypothetical protein